MNFKTEVLKNRITLWIRKVNMFKLNVTPWFWQSRQPGIAILGTLGKKCSQTVSRTKATLHLTVDIGQPTDRLCQ